jgi:hypothetical protein
MLPKWHVLLGILFATVLYVIGFGFEESLIVFFASFLIDIDHYMYYVMRKGKYNLREAYVWFKSFSRKQKENKAKEQVRHPRLFIFHTYESLFMLLFLGFFFPFCFFILTGFVFHRISDDTFSFFTGSPFHYFSLFQAIF